MRSRTSNSTLPLGAFLTGTEPRRFLRRARYVSTGSSAVAAKLAWNFSSNIAGDS